MHEFEQQFKVAVYSGMMVNRSCMVSSSVESHIIFFFITVSEFRAFITEECSPETGKNYRLKCIVRYGGRALEQSFPNTRAVFKWFRDGKEIRGILQNCSGGPDTSSLAISKLQDNDFGKYTCSVTLRANKRTVTVKSDPFIVSCWYEQQDSDL